MNRQMAILLIALGLAAISPCLLPAQFPAGDAAWANQVPEPAGPLLRNDALALASTLAPQGSAAEDPPLRRESTRDYWHVFLAFGCAWVLIFGYLVMMGRRFGQLEEEVRRLRATS